MRLPNLIGVIVMSPRSVRPNVIHRPGEGTSLREGLWCRDLPELLRASCRAAAALKGTPSTGMRRTITTSQRASPTLALLMPARLAIRISQLFSCEQPLSRLVSMIWASSLSAVRNEPSPILPILAGLVDLAGLMLLRRPGQSRDRDGVCIWAPCASCKPSKPRS